MSTDIDVMVDNEDKSKTYAAGTITEKLRPF